MTRPLHDDDHPAYDVISRMVAFLRAKSAEDARLLGERTIEERQARTYKAATLRDEERHSNPARRSPALPKKEQDRRRLFDLARPETILQPANLVEAYLHDHSCGSHGTGRRRTASTSS